MDGLEAVMSLLNQNGMRGEVWVNGSFTTEKLNPDDCDILLSVQMADVQKFTPLQRTFLEWFKRTNLKSSHKCDNYAIVQDETHPANDWVVAYWLRQFGFSRANSLKGLAVLQLPYVVLP